MFLRSAVNLNSPQLAINPVGNVREDFSIIIFIIFGEDMVNTGNKMSWWIMQPTTFPKTVKFLFEKLLIHMAEYEQPLTGNQELDRNKTALITWTRHFCFKLQNSFFFFITLVFWIIFTSWDVRLTQSDRNSESVRSECLSQDKHPETRPPPYNNTLPHHVSMDLQTELQEQFQWSIKSLTLNMQHRCGVNMESRRSWTGHSTATSSCSAHGRQSRLNVWGYLLSYI